MRFKYLFVIMIFFPTPVFAATKKITRPPGFTSEKTYKKLKAVHEAREKGKFQEALTILEELEPRTEKRPFEHALVYQTRGFILAQMEKYKESLVNLENALALEVLPESPHLTTMYIVAQLHTATLEYDKALAMLNNWFEYEANPKSSAYMLRAQVLAQLKDYKKAIIDLEKSISMDEKFDLNKYKLLYAIAYQLDENAKAAEALKAIINNDPRDKNQWLQLSGLYAKAGDNGKASSVLELAYKQGMLDKEGYVKSLASYLMDNQNYYSAGELVESEIAKGGLEKSSATYKLLGASWLLAHEDEKAIDAFKIAAEKSKDPQDYVRIAQIYVKMEKWQDAAGYYEKALKNGKMAGEKKADLQIALGMVYFQAGNSPKAKAIFEKAAQFEGTKEKAIKWLDYIDS